MPEEELDPDELVLAAAELVPLPLLVLLLLLLPHAASARTHTTMPKHDRAVAPGVRLLIRVLLLVIDG
ncbi:MAG: hypothetical protein ACRDPA_17020 [Solirubrobacteraceae bacterium]